jgi:hypothetical protein
MCRTSEMIVNPYILAPSIERTMLQAEKFNVQPRSVEKGFSVRREKRTFDGEV